MLSKLLFVAIAAVVTALPSSEPRTATAPVLPNPSDVYLNSFTYGGTGCPQGTVGSFISADRTTFTLIFDNFVASIGPGITVTEQRKNCQLNLDLQYPGGFQYSVFSTIYRGFVGIDKGITATQSANYYFSGQTAQTSTSTTFKGPLSQDYEVADNVTLTSTLFSPCGAQAALNVNSAVALTSSVASASGEITDDTIDGQITFIVGVQWQTC